MQDKEQGRSASQRNSWDLQRDTSCVQQNADWHMCVKTLSKDWGKNHLEVLEEIVAGTHTRPGIVLVPTSQTEKLHISRGFR